MKVQGSRIKNGLVLCSVSRATYFYLHFVRVVRTVFCATTYCGSDKLLGPRSIFEKNSKSCLKKNRNVIFYGQQLQTALHDDFESKYDGH